MSASTSSPLTTTSCKSGSPSRLLLGLPWGIFSPYLHQCDTRPELANFILLPSVAYGIGTSSAMSLRKPSTFVAQYCPCLAMMAFTTSGITSQFAIIPPTRGDEREVPLTSLQSLWSFLRHLPSYGAQIDIELPKKCLSGMLNRCLSPRTPPTTMRELSGPASNPGKWSST